MDPWHFGVNPVPRLRATDPDSDPDRAFLLVADKMLTKNGFFQSFFAFYFLKIHLHQFLKIKVKKNSQNSSSNQFFLLFLLIDGRIRIRTNNDGSGGPKNIPTDPDPRYRCKYIMFAGSRRAASATLTTSCSEFWSSSSITKGSWLKF